MGLSAAAQKAMPSVVNVFTSTVIKTPIHPFTDDPRFRFFFAIRAITKRKTVSVWFRRYRQCRWLHSPPITMWWKPPTRSKLRYPMAARPKRMSSL